LTTTPNEAAQKRAFNRSSTLNLFRTSTLNQAAAKLAFKNNKSPVSQRSNVRADFNLIKPETSTHGDIKLNDFATFFRQGWGWCGFVGIILLSILVAGTQLIPTFWLSHWTTKS
jgi:hypothetical protein